MDRRDSCYGRTVHAREKHPLYNQDRPVKKVNAVLTSFLERMGKVHEDEVFHLLFYIDYRHAEEYGEPLTGAEYTPARTDAYSYDVSAAIEEGDYIEKMPFFSGGKTYYTGTRNPVEDKQVDAFVERICVELRERGLEDADDRTEQLPTFTHRTEAWQESDYGQILDFSLITE